MTVWQYQKRFYSLLPAWSKATGYSVPGLFLRYAVCRIFHGVNSEEFLALRMYRYNAATRRQFLFYDAIKRLSDRLSAGATTEDVAQFKEKSRFNAAFRDFIRRDWLYLPESTPDEVRAFVARNETFLAKACVSTQGKNIFLHHSDGLDPDALIRDYEGKPFLLEAFIRQHPVMSALNPSTVNTIRVLTLRKGADVLLVGGCLRCGSADAYVDNFHSGGVAYPIDIETGVITAPGRRLLEHDTFLRHPSTGAVMPGFRIPCWDEVKDMIRRAADVNPRIACVGWDVAISEDGPELIEGNINYPDPIVVQLDDKGVVPAIREFLRRG